jgi:hypothetical protein
MRQMSMTLQSKHLPRLTALTLAALTLATLTLAGCGGMPNLSLPARNDFKGKPVSVIVARLGNPDYQQTISGQKFFMWRIGMGTQECLIAAGIVSDMVDSYNATGDAAICAPYVPPAQPPAAQ